MTEFELNVLQDRIYLELQLGLGSFKSTNMRSSSTVLDMLGDVGGFHQSIGFFFFMFGEFFAAQFFL